MAAVELAHWHICGKVKVCRCQIWTCSSQVTCMQACIELLEYRNKNISHLHHSTVASNVEIYSGCPLWCWKALEDLAFQFYWIMLFIDFLIPCRQWQCLVRWSELSQLNLLESQPLKWLSTLSILPEFQLRMSRSVCLGLQKSLILLRISRHLHSRCSYWETLLRIERLQRMCSVP